MGLGQEGWDQEPRPQPWAGWGGAWHLGEEEFAVEQVGELSQPLFHSGAPALRDTQVPVQGRLLVPREEDPLGIHLIVEEGDATAQKVTGEIGHLGHEVCGAEEAGLGRGPHATGAGWGRVLQRLPGLRSAASPVNSFLQRSRTLLSRFSSWIWTFL